MDISITSEAEERPNVNNVPDYVSDIHTYLREMEVRCSLVCIFGLSAPKDKLLLQ